MLFEKGHAGELVTLKMVKEKPCFLSDEKRSRGVLFYKFRKQRKQSYTYINEPQV